MKSASAKLFLDLHTMSAPSGEERTLGASAQQVERARCCRRFDSDTQTRVWQCHCFMVLVSSASGPRVSGCPSARRHFRPHPVAYFHIDAEHLKRNTTNTTEVSNNSTHFKQNQTGRCKALCIIGCLLVVQKVVCMMQRHYSRTYKTVRHHA